MCIFLKRYEPFEGYFIILHNPTPNLYFHVPFCCEGNWKKLEGAIALANRLRDFSLIYLEKLNFCYNYMLDEITPQPQMYL